MASRNGTAAWIGDLPGGCGRLTVGDDHWTAPFSFASRFEDGDGTNPEALIAAAHAGCFAMALVHVLSGAGHQPARIDAQARLHLRNIDGLPTIARIDLATEGDVPGLDEATFAAFAERARTGCAVSRALTGVGEITVRARLARPGAQTASDSAADRSRVWSSS